MANRRDYAPCSFKVDGGPTINVMARVFGENGRLRIAPRARAYRPGAKLDHTGAGEDGFQFEILFPGETTEGEQDVEEEGVTDDGGVLPLYPDRMDQLKAAFKSGATMTMNFLRLRGVRVKCATWDIRETTEEGGDGGGAVMTGTLTEDNEDNIDRESILQRSPRASLIRRTEETVFDAEANAAWVPSLADLTQLASELVGIMQSATEPIEQVKAAVARFRAIGNLVAGQLSTDTPGRDQLLGPESATMRVKLMELEDLSAQAEAEWRKSQPRTRYHYPEQDTSIWAIAAELKQDVRQLMELNSGDFEDFAQIEGGVGVRVLA